MSAKSKADYAKAFGGGNFLSGLVGSKAAKTPTTAFDPPPLEGTIADEALPQEHLPIPGVVVPTTKREGFLVDLNLIESFEDNPRTMPYREYESLRGSILVNGLKNRLIITKRPTQPHFIVAEGANTRLRALKDIVANYDELSAAAIAEGAGTPGAPAPLPRSEFVRLSCDFVPYAGELPLYEAHERENSNREDLVWWDQAKSAMVHKEKLELANGAEISLGAFARYRQSLNRPKATASLEFLSRAQFAVTYLRAFGDRFPDEMQTARIATIRSTLNVARAILLTHNASCRAEEILRSWADDFLPDPESDEPGLEQLADYWRKKTLHRVGVPMDDLERVWARAEELYRSKKSGLQITTAVTFDSMAELLAVFPEEQNTQANTDSTTPSPPTPQRTKPSVNELRDRLQAIYSRHGKSLSKDCSRLIESVMADSGHPITELAKLSHGASAEAKIGREFFKYVRALAEQSDE